MFLLPLGAVLGTRSVVIVAFVLFQVVHLSAAELPAPVPVKSVGPAPEGVSKPGLLSRFAIVVPFVSSAVRVASFLGLVSLRSLIRFSLMSFIPFFGIGLA
jgi:hypothetical protein